MHITPIVTFASIFFAVATSSAFAQTELEPVEALPLTGDERAYLVEDGEADISDGLIRRISIGHENVTASYRNRGDKAKRPEYTVRLYNRYGLLLAEDDVTSGFLGGVGTIDPGEIEAEELHVDHYPLDRIAAKSGITLPDDWDTVNWVVIADTNTRLPAAERDNSSDTQSGD